MQDCGAFVLESPDGARLRRATANGAWPDENIGGSAGV